jgi:hypothetical protein
MHTRRHPCTSGHLQEPRLRAAVVVPIGHKVIFGGVNFKKPPYYSVKFEKPPLFSEIVKNHRYYVGCLQYALMVPISSVNAISNKQDPLTG